MASSFSTDSFDQVSDDSRPAPKAQAFDDEDSVYVGYDSFSNFAGSESVVDSAIGGESPVYVSGSGFSADPAEISSFSTEPNGMGFDGGYAAAAADGPILPPPAEMEHEEGFALREWRRLNAIRLEEKEKRERELLSQIIEEAEDYKVDFYSKRKVSCEAGKAANREKEKVFLASQEKFHADADKNFWKTIADLIPNEVPTIKKRGKKDQEKQPSIVVVQGPKPGKPTDLARMRQILIKLKHNTPPHLKHSPLPAPTTKDAKTGSEGSIAASAPHKDVPVAAPTEAVAVA